MRALIPAGYKLIAVSQLTGTGGAEAKAYYHAEFKKLYIVLYYSSRELKQQQLAFGPVDTIYIDTLKHLISDIAEMKGNSISYITE